MTISDVFRPVSRHIQPTVEPPGIMLLRPDGVVVPQRAEDSEVSAHEISGGSRVQLTVYIETEGNRARII